jgi:hypothetical protein
MRPTRIQFDLVVAIAVARKIIKDFSGRIFGGINPDMLIAGAQAQGIELVEWKSKIDLAPKTCSECNWPYSVGAVDIPIIQAEPKTNAVQRVIRIVEGDVVVLADVAVVENHTQLIAGTQKIVLGHAGIKQQTRFLTVTDAEHQTARGRSTSV